MHREMTEFVPFERLAFKSRHHPGVFHNIFEFTPEGGSGGKVMMRRVELYGRIA